MKLKLQRDNVISSTDKGDLVGLFVIVPKDKDICGLSGISVEIPVGAEILLAEFPPEKADKIIEAWNK